MKNYKFIDNPCNHSLFGDGMLWSIGLSSMNDKPTINEDSIFDFSKHLFVKGEIQLSKLELSRIAYNKNHNQLTIQKANLLLALCEFLDDKILKTIDIVSDLDKIDDMELKYNYFILNYLAGDSKKLYEYNINLCLKNDFNSKESITDKLLVYTYYINGELDKSIDLLEKLSITEKNIGLDTIPCYLKENFKKNIKSPLLAGIMSTIIPGSGYVYSGRYKEGISAFLINGLLGIGIYSLFNSGNIGSGVLTSMVCLPFYLGNIIGASNAAATENNKYQQYILLNLRNSLKISFVFSTGQLLEFWN
jgi:hypothetical protein